MSVEIKMYWMERIPIHCLDCIHFIDQTEFDLMNIPSETDSHVGCKQNSSFILAAYDKSQTYCAAFVDKTKEA